MGYVIRKGYDLPPINFDGERADADSVGLGMIASTGDAGLWQPAKRAARKLNETASGTRRLVTSPWSMGSTPKVEPPEIRNAIRAEMNVRINYCDAESHETERVICPPS